MNEAAAESRFSPAIVAGHLCWRCPRARSKPERIVARKTLDRGSASPVGYALRTLSHSAMFGRTNIGSVANMAIAIRSNRPIPYPLLSAGAFTAAHAVRETGPAGAPKPRLLDRVREAIGARH